MKTMFAITHVTKNDRAGNFWPEGVRRLTFANQGRNHYDTREEAQAALDGYVADGSLRSKVLGDAADTLEVREVECYDHGDATRTIFD